MLSDYKKHGFKITAKRLPKNCAVCPFLLHDSDNADVVICLLSSQINKDGVHEERRMSKCPIKKQKQQRA